MTGMKSFVAVTSIRLVLVLLLALFPYGGAQINAAYHVKEGVMSRSTVRRLKDQKLPKTTNPTKSPTAQPTSAPTVAPTTIAPTGPPCTKPGDKCTTSNDKSGRCKLVSGSITCVADNKKI